MSTVPVQVTLSLTLPKLIFCLASGEWWCASWVGPLSFLCEQPRNRIRKANTKFPNYAEWTSNRKVNGRGDGKGGCWGKGVAKPAKKKKINWNETNASASVDRLSNAEALVFVFFFCRNKLKKKIKLCTFGLNANGSFISFRETWSVGPPNQKGEHT